MALNSTVPRRPCKIREFSDKQNVRKAILLKTKATCDLTFNASSQSFLFRDRLESETIVSC